MQQVTGRLTADATVKTLESGKQVVNFNIAENQGYKPKGSDDWVDIPTFFNCSYWIDIAKAKLLRKGASVLLSGRISARAYETNAGGIAASLNFHANRIEMQSYAPKEPEEPKKAGGKTSSKPKAAQQQEERDDLPF